jgi:hypothetical protein
MVESSDPVTWITPLAAAHLFAPLYNDFASAQQVLVSYAGGGLIRSQCRRLTAKKALAHEPIAYSQDNVWIDADFWEAYADGTRRVYTDWGTGQFAANRYQNKAWWQYRVFSVSFVEEDIRAIQGIAPKPPPAPAPPLVQLQLAMDAEAARRPRLPAPEAKPLAKNDVNDVEVRAWHAGLPAVDQRRGWRWLYAEAKEHFLPRHVAKKLILGLVAGRKLGRPRKME